VFLSLLRFSAASKTEEILFSHFDAFFNEQWYEKWGITMDQKRILFLAILQIYESRSDLNQQNKSLQVLIRYLNSYVDSQEIARNFDSEISKYCKNAVVLAIKLPEVVYCDYLLEIEAVKVLKEKEPKLWELLKVFAAENLGQFKEFIGKSPNYLESIGLDYKQCLKKMRLLSLASLANELEAGPKPCEIKYEKISATLELEESKVEKWVIRAISANIIDAKLDQLRRVVIINWSSQREFKKKQWEVLAKQIANWKDSIANLQKLIKEKKIKN